MHSPSPTLILLLALTWRSAAQQSSACSLLTLGDIEAATGLKAGTPHPSDYPITEGSTKADTVHACMWPITAEQGQLILSIGRLPAGMSAEVVTKHNPGIDALRAAHWTEEAKDFANGWCSIFTPPASQTHGLMMSTCSAEVKGTILSLVFTSPTRKLSIAQAKALLDKASGRQR